MEGITDGETTENPLEKDHTPKLWEDMFSLDAGDFFLALGGFFIGAIISLILLLSHPAGTISTAETIAILLGSALVIRVGFIFWFHIVVKQ